MKLAAATSQAETCLMFTTEYGKNKTKRSVIPKYLYPNLNTKKAPLESVRKYFHCHTHFHY